MDISSVTNANFWYFASVAKQNAEAKHLEDPDSNDYQTSTADLHELDTDDPELTCFERQFLAWKERDWKNEPRPPPPPARSPRPLPHQEKEWTLQPDGPQKSPVSLPGFFPPGTESPSVQIFPYTLRPQGVYGRTDTDSTTSDVPSSVDGDPWGRPAWRGDLHCAGMRRSPEPEFWGTGIYEPIDVSFGKKVQMVYKLNLRRENKRRKLEISRLTEKYDLTEDEDMHTNASTPTLRRRWKLISPDSGPLFRDRIVRRRHSVADLEACRYLDQPAGRLYRSKSVGAETSGPQREKVKIKASASSLFRKKDKSYQNLY